MTSPSVGNAGASQTSLDPNGDSVAASGTTVSNDVSHSGEVIASVAYRDGVKSQDVAVEDIGKFVDQEHSLLWVGLKSPSTERLSQVARALNLGEKAVEELNAPHRRPKIIDFGKAVLVVAITVEVTTQKPSFGETQLLIGQGFLLTVRRGATATHSELRQRLEAAPELLARGSDFVASEVLDLIVDRYIVAATKFEHLVEQAEQKLLIRGQKDADVRSIYKQRRDLLRIHTAIAPLAEICRRIARIEMCGIDAQARPYFTEVADRVLRVDELISGLREALAFAFEASLMIGQSQQNDTTRKLASWAAILAVPTAIAGIYGMNFEFMPELKSKFGYPITLSVITLTCSFLYWRFKRSGWL